MTPPSPRLRRDNRHRPCDDDQNCDAADGSHRFAPHGAPRVGAIAAGDCDEMEKSGSWERTRLRRPMGHEAQKNPLPGGSGPCAGLVQPGASVGTTSEETGRRWDVHRRQHGPAGAAGGESGECDGFHGEVQNDAGTTPWLHARFQKEIGESRRSRTAAKEFRPKTVLPSLHGMISSVRQ
jgi:hypothetical protein